MSDFNAQERISKILMLEKSLNNLSKESIVRKPYPSIKTLFNGNYPKNRKNLKKLVSQNTNSLRTYTKRINKPKYKPPNIQSVIRNSLTNEFLNLDFPNNNHIKPIIIPINNYSNGYTPSTLYNLDNNNKNSVIPNNLKKSVDVVSNHSINNKFINSMDENVMKIKKISKMSNGINNKKPLNLNDLYNEFIKNVSKILFNNIYINIEYNSKITIIKKFNRTKKKHKL